MHLSDSPTACPQLTCAGLNDDWARELAHLTAQAALRRTTEQLRDLDALSRHLRDASDPELWLSLVESHYSAITEAADLGGSDMWPVGTSNTITEHDRQLLTAQLTAVAGLIKLRLAEQAEALMDAHLRTFAALVGSVEQVR